MESADFDRVPKERMQRSADRTSPAGVIAIVPAGLLFAFAYQRWNRLWPLVFAHGLLDALGILNSR